MKSKLLRPVDPYPFVPRNPATLAARCEEILAIQVAGLTRRLRGLASISGKDLVPVSIGVSGGLDSTLALLVVTRVFDSLGWDKKNILAHSMPGFGTTARTKSNSEKICAESGVSFKEINISDAVTQHLRAIGHEPCRKCVRCQNAQARERTQILMDTAFTIGTGDLSEIALGWCTYNADHMSMYNPNCGVPKTLIKHLVVYIAGRGDTAEAERSILGDIVDTPISPELEAVDPNGASAQKTEELVGPYELHDFMLFHIVRNGFAPRKILFLLRVVNGQKDGFSRRYEDGELLKWLKVFYERFGDVAQFKRNAGPDGPKVGSVSLSQRGDWRMPSDISLRAWLKDLANVS